MEKDRPPLASGLRIIKLEDSLKPVSKPRPAILLGTCGYKPPPNR